MNTKLIGWSSLAILILFAFMIIMMLIMPGTIDSVETVEQYVEHQTSSQTRYNIGAIFSFILTMITVLLFTALYNYCKIKNHFWSFFAVLLLPVYVVFSTVISFGMSLMSKILIQMYNTPELQGSASMLIEQLLPGSAGLSLSLGNLPYAFLGIPSIIFGYFLTKESKMIKVAGILILINGIGYMFGFISMFFESRILHTAGSLGAVAFLAALIVMSIAFLKRSKED